MKFKLRFPKKEIPYWADRFPSDNEDWLMHEVGPLARKRGYLMLDEFIRICKWKTPRSQPLVRSNSRAAVERLTRSAFSSRDDGEKMDQLRKLAGVSWPTASVILHFCDKKPFPILDVRALWSLGFTKPPGYTMEFWLEYTDFVRQLSRSTKHSMRVIDRALWQYSFERQR